MRTEQDLHSAFRALEEVADAYGTPDFAIPTPTLPAVRTIRPARRNWVAVSSSVAVAAAIAALVIGVVVTRGPSTPNRPGVTQSGTSTPPSHTSTAVGPPKITAPKTFDLRSLWFSLRPINGLVVSGVTLFATSQQVNLDSGSGQHWDVTLNAAGASKPTAATGSESIQIGGRPGYYGYLTDPGSATLANQPVGLVWEYAPGAWATVVSDDAQRAISSTDATAVAASVEPGRTQAVKVPIKVGLAPVGMRLQGYLGGPGGSRLTQSGSTVGVNAGIDFTAGNGTSLSVSFYPRLAGETLTGTPTTIAGRTAYIMNGSIRILVSGNYEVDATAGPNGPNVSAAQLLAVAQSIEVASNPQDQGTWFDATVALP